MVLLECEVARASPTTARGKGMRLKGLRGDEQGCSKMVYGPEI